ncbi:unnamed protein product [Caenorhabditis bovis]|uniref:Uncharacterized protein n=1 Tax=Caenorhabditis bovis TaxID=2654633 RepID=A0A8S1FBD3_9PELO|nr:unnamed protein product [Caenorhabditis bovis]
MNPAQQENEQVDDLQQLVRNYIESMDGIFAQPDEENSEFRNFLYNIDAYDQIDRIYIQVPDVARPRDDENVEEAQQVQEPEQLPEPEPEQAAEQETEQAPQQEPERQPKLEQAQLHEQEPADHVIIEYPILNDSELEEVHYLNAMQMLNIVAENAEVDGPILFRNFVNLSVGFASVEIRNRVMTSRQNDGNHADSDDDQVLTDDNEEDPRESRCKCSVCKTSRIRSPQRCRHCHQIIGYAYASGWIVTAISPTRDALFAPSVGRLKEILKTLNRNQCCSMSDPPTSGEHPSSDTSDKSNDDRQTLSNISSNLESSAENEKNVENELNTIFQTLELDTSENTNTLENPEIPPHSDAPTITNPSKRLNSSIYLIENLLRPESPAKTEKDYELMMDFFLNSQFLPRLCKNGHLKDRELQDMETDNASEFQPEIWNFDLQRWDRIETPEFDAEMFDRRRLDTGYDYGYGFGFSFGLAQDEFDINRKMGYRSLAFATQDSNNPDEWSSFLPPRPEDFEFCYSITEEEEVNPSAHSHDNEEHVGIPNDHDSSADDQYEEIMEEDGVKKAAKEEAEEDDDDEAGEDKE